MKNKNALHASATLLAALLGGCSVTPEAVTEPQAQERVVRDRAAMFAAQEAIAGPIGFEEAVARALKYNLDLRLKAMESALSMGLADVAKYEMLPNVVASAGYVSRNNDAGGNSVNIETGAVSLAQSTSVERNRSIAAAEFSWNVLDFGVSYYRARQQADQVLIADERRRRVVQNILQDVRSAYWRAVGAQRLAREATSLSERARSALERSREAERQGLVPPRDALGYQRLLLDALSLLSTRQQELNFAKHELTALMNVPPGVTFTLIEADEPELRALPGDIAALEEMALRHRPELREEDYRVRITAADARRQLLALMPGLSFGTSAQYDSNDYLYNNRWVDSGIHVSLNLLKLLSLPSLRHTHDAQQKADEARRLALSMAVLTQVRVAIERYRMALHDLGVAKESSLVDQRMTSYAKAGLSTRMESELELIRTETRTLNSEYQRYAAYAAAQTAFGRIYNAVGLEVATDDIAQAPVAELGRQVGLRIAGIESNAFPKAANAAQTLPPLRVRIELPRAEAADTAEVASAVEKALTRNQVPTPQPQGRTPTLMMRLALQPPRDGVRRAEWQLSFAQADGSVKNESRYASTLPAATTGRMLAAFGEAAAVAHLPLIEQWLRASPAK